MEWLADDRTELRLIQSEQAFAASLDAKGKASYVKVFLDEFEATLESTSKAQELSPDSLKAARVWGEHLKRMLRLMGHHKRLPIIGGPRTPITETAEDIFGGKVEEDG